VSGGRRQPPSGGCAMDSHDRPGRPAPVVHAHLGLGQHVLASSIGGLVARGVTYPLDTLKTILQVHTEHAPGQGRAVPRSAYLAQVQRPVLAAVRKRGLLSLYQGVGIACLLGTPALSIYYTTYDKSKELCCMLLGQEEETTSIHVVSAAMAEIVSGAIWTPMELVKQKLQVKGALKKKVPSPAPVAAAEAAAAADSAAAAAPAAGTSGLVQRIHEKHGWGGFYRGYLLGLMVFVPFSACYFISYEKLKTMMARRHLEAGGEEGSRLEPVELSFMEYMSASAVSAVIGSAIANPMDVVKTRWQVNRQIPSKVESPLQLARHMYRHEGISSFTKGIGARAMYTVPYVAISMAIYELIKLRLS